MNEAEKILKELKQKQFKPIYFLMGDEPYYIDKISDYIEQNTLSESEKDFNQVVLYGRDTSLDEIISEAKIFPMMADHRVIIIKEAQDLSRYINKKESEGPEDSNDKKQNSKTFENYIENPQSTTILVFCYKYKTLDKRKKITKNIEKNGVVFESKKLYENQVGSWISKLLSASRYSIEPKANAMLVEFLGTDLSRINNEIEKLKIVIPKGVTITADHIEKNIGISKNYNIFEFQKALGTKNIAKANQITKYFAQNQKDNHINLVTVTVFNFFVKLLQYHGTTNKNPENIAKIIGVNSFFVKDYEVAARNFPMKKVSQIIASLREIDMKSKGVGAYGLTADDLFKDMLASIFL